MKIYFLFLVHLYFLRLNNCVIMAFFCKDKYLLLFLDAYRKCDCLWDNKSQEYSKTNIRDKAYKSLIEELNLPELTIVRRC